SQVGALSAFLSSDEQVAMLAVSVLFSRVAVALSQLEDAAGLLESTAARFVFQPAYGSLLSTEDYRRVVAERLDAAFHVMKEVADLSRVTIKSVLAHPVYGLGPGPAHLGQAERDELASAAGLNGRNLAL